MDKNLDEIEIPDFLSDVTIDHLKIPEFRECRLVLRLRGDIRI
jgi:hypothetical protein